MDLIELFKESITINLKDYSSIDIDFPIGYFLLFIFAAFIIATIAINSRRAILHSVTAKLLRHDATNEENAKNLKSLGFKKSTVKAVLTSGGQFKTIFAIKGAPEYSYEEYTKMIKERGYKESKVDCDNSEIYIRPESLTAAKAITEATPPTVLTTALFCLLILACYICLNLLLPEILNFVNSMLK